METISDPAIQWPPEYNIRLSQKAKRLYLRIVPNLGLEIVIPIRQQKRCNINQVLTEYKEWIEKHLTGFQIQPATLITELNLRAIQQTWEIKYQQTFSSQIRNIAAKGLSSNTLNLYGAVDNIPRTHLWLQNWLKQIAQDNLLPWLTELSLQHDLPFSKAGIRAQTTLWGSCTTSKNISLNYKLLFMPRELAQHILLHELCHTKHMNHSRKFWNLLTQLDPLCAQHDYAIRKGEKYVPAWINLI